MDESFGAFRKAPEESVDFTTKPDDDWIHGVHNVLTLLDYVPHLSNDSTTHSTKERYFDCRLSFRDLGSTDTRNRQFSLCSDGNSESDYSEAPEKELVKRDFVSDDYGSAFSGLLHLPAVSLSGGKLDSESANSHKSYYSSSFKIGELSYLFGGLVVDLHKSLKSLGIPLSTDLSNISVHCATTLPPYMDKALITSPMFVPNKRIHTSNPARSTIIHVNHDTYESKSPYDICDMTGTQISESQIFFCGGFKVITDKVEFDSRTNRWMVYKSIEVNRHGFILDVKTFTFSNIKISSNSDFIYDGKVGFAMCSSVVNAFEAGKKVFSNSDSVKTELSSPVVPISSPGPVYPSAKLKYPGSVSTSPSHSNSVSTTPVSAKSPTSTKSINSMKSPTSSHSHPYSTRSAASESVLDGGSKSTLPTREKFTNALNNTKERSTLSSHTSVSRDPTLGEDDRKSPPSSKASSYGGRPTSQSSSHAGSSHSITRVSKLKEDKYGKAKASDKKTPEDSDSKTSHKFMLAIPGRLFHRSGKHGSNASPLPSPSVGQVIRAKALNAGFEAKETKETVERKEYIEKVETQSKRSESHKKRVVAESETTSPASKQGPVSPEMYASTGTSSLSSTAVSTFQLEKMSSRGSQSEAFKSVSQPSSAKDARSGSRGSEEVFFSRASSSDGSVHRQSSVESKNDTEERPSLKLKTGVRREQAFEPIEETLNPEATDENKANVSPENPKSSIPTVCVYIFGGFYAKQEADGRQTFVALNDLLKLELIVSEPSTLQFHPEAFIISIDQTSVIPKRRGFFASMIVSAESAKNLLENSPNDDASKMAETVAALKAQQPKVCATKVSKSRDQLCAEHSFDDKCLLVHGGVDEHFTVYGDSFLFSFKRNTWIQFKTFSYDYYGIPKQPYEDEDVESLRLDQQLDNPKYGEAELRACHHNAKIITEGDLEYLVFVGGYYNHYLRHFDPKPYTSDKIDISRLIRLSLTMNNSNLLRMPILNLSTQTWYLKRYFYEFSNHVTPRCAELLDNEIFLNANTYVTGGEISVLGKQIVIFQGQVQIVPSKFADFAQVREVTGTPHILMGGHVLITFPGI